MIRRDGKLYARVGGRLVLAQDQRPRDTVGHVVEEEDADAVDVKTDTLSAPTPWCPAHFYPKFANTGDSGSFDVISNAKKGDTVLFTVKHSGSLVLVRGQRRGPSSKDGAKEEHFLVFNSKNATDNTFTAVAEKLLRAMMKHTRKDPAAFAKYLCETRTCLGFEVVTTYLGDHGQRPRLPYMVLTMMATREHFRSFYEMVAFARRWSLVTTEAWALEIRDEAKDKATLKEIENLRWTGDDADFRILFERKGARKIKSLLSHDKVQGHRLEGLVVHLVRGAVVKKEKDDDDAAGATKSTEDDPAERLMGALRTFEWSERKDAKMSNPARTIKTLDDPVAFCERVGKMSGPLAKTFACLTKMQARRKSRSSLVRITRVEREGMTTYIVNVLNDSTFKTHARENEKDASPLFRGLEICLEGGGGGGGGETTARGDGVAIVGTSKWKCLKYLRATILIRNKWGILSGKGSEAYLAEANRQIASWKMPADVARETSRFVEHWAQWFEDHHIKDTVEKDRYLGAYERFLEAYDSGSIDLRRGRARSNLAMVVVSFLKDGALPEGFESDVVRKAGCSLVASASDHAKKKGGNKKGGNKNPPLRPGAAYVMTCAPRKDMAKNTNGVPVVFVYARPEDGCEDRRRNGMFQGFKKKLKDYETDASIVSAHDATDLLDRVRALNDKFAPLERKIVVSFVACPPGTGKSSVRRAMRERYEGKTEEEFRVVSSDDIARAERLQPGTNSLKSKFDEALKRALLDPRVKIIVVDKNVPNEVGFRALREALTSTSTPVEILAVVPDRAFFENEALVWRRVASREHDGFRLTAKSTPPKPFKSAETWWRYRMFNPAKTFRDHVAEHTKNAPVVVSKFLDEGRADDIAAQVFESFKKIGAKRDFYVGVFFEHNGRKLHATYTHSNTSDWTLEQAEAFVEERKDEQVNIRAVRRCEIPGVVEWLSLEFDDKMKLAFDAPHATVRCAKHVSPHEARLGEIEVRNGRRAASSREIKIEDIKDLSFKGTWRVRKL